MATPSSRRPGHRAWLTVLLVALVAAFTLALAACGDDDEPSASVSAPASPSATTPSVATGPEGCSDAVPAAANQPKQSYDAPPPLTIDPAKKYTATMVTSCGTIVLELDPAAAPNTVNNFVFLARE